MCRGGRAPISQLPRPPPASDPASQVISSCLAKHSCHPTGTSHPSLIPLRAHRQREHPQHPGRTALGLRIPKAAPKAGLPGARFAPYRVRAAPRGSGRCAGRPAARTGGAGSGGTRCEAGAWGARSLGMQKQMHELGAELDHHPLQGWEPPQIHSRCPILGAELIFAPWGWGIQVVASPTSAQRGTAGS